MSSDAKKERFISGLDKQGLWLYCSRKSYSAFVLSESEAMYFEHVSGIDTLTACAFTNCFVLGTMEQCLTDGAYISLKHYQWSRRRFPSYRCRNKTAEHIKRKATEENTEGTTSLPRA